MNKLETKVKENERQLLRGAALDGGLVQICRGCGHLESEHYDGEWVRPNMSNRWEVDCSKCTEPCYSQLGEDITSISMWRAMDEFAAIILNAGKLKTK